MEILDKDFKIQHDGNCFVLSFLKTKKELKVDASDSYQTHGYYSDIFNAFYAVYQWRLEKKYPFKESATELKKAMQKYMKVTALLSFNIGEIYSPILELKKQIFNGNK